MVICVLSWVNLIEVLERIGSDRIFMTVLCEGLDSKLARIAKSEKIEFCMLSQDLLATQSLIYVIQYKLQNLISPA